MKFSDLEFKQLSVTSVKHLQAVVQFTNGYGASVITGDYTRGGDKGLYELAVLLNDNLCYDTPITEDVIGYQTSEEIEALLKQIEELPYASST